MTALGFIMGTPDYMSPEQARGPEIHQRSDIFSAAAVFYYMLSGHKPFAASDLPTVLRKVQTEDPPPLPESDVPAPLSRIVARSLAKEPAHRHQKMADFVADLAKFHRYYEAETRQIAATAYERYSAIEDLAKERGELSEWLGLPLPDDEPQAACRLREEHSAFVEHGREARDAQLAGLAAEARAAVKARNWTVAAVLSDEALLIDPHTAEFSAFRAQARDAIDRDAREPARELQRTLDGARRAIAERRLDAADQEIGRGAGPDRGDRVATDAPAGRGKGEGRRYGRHGSTPQALKSRWWPDSAAV